MQTIADLVAEARERDATLFASVDDSVDHSYEAVCTTAWKAGNLLRHYGVRPGDSVAVVVGPADPTEQDETGRLGDSPTPILAILGGMLAGASVTLDPVAAVEAKALVAPTAWLDDYTPGPGTKPIGYGGEVTEPTVAQFEREAWSENPVEPPVELDPTTTAIGGTEQYTHGDLLAEARRLVAETGLEAGDRLALAAPFTPGSLVAGVLAPLSVGATIVIVPDEEAAEVGFPAVDVVVTDSAATSDRLSSDAIRIDPSTVLAGRRD